MKKESYIEEVKGYKGAYKRYRHKFNLKFNQSPPYVPQFNMISVKGGLKHAVVKTILVKLLMDRGYQVTTEQPIIDGDGNERKADVYCVNTDTIFEIEGGLTPKKREGKKKYGEYFNDIFIIDLDKVPEDIKAAYNHLNKVI